MHVGATSGQPQIWTGASGGGASHAPQPTESQGNLVSSMAQELARRPAPSQTSSLFSSKLSLLA
jgi:hypothetical protein